MRRVVILAALLFAGFLRAGAQAVISLPPQSQIKMTTYVVGVIPKGPNWGTGTAVDRQRIQEGHMANIRKMASIGKLIVAGPIENSNLRGLFIFSISSTDEARALVSEDPAVASGRLAVDFYQWYAAVGLKVDLQTVPLADPVHEQAIKIVNQIQRADYEGDRAALKNLYDELAPFVENKELASRVRYWRGFALWRRAINGFNDSLEPKELKEDLKQAADEFDSAARNDPSFVDAKIAALSCVSLLAFSVNENDTAQVQELLTRGRQLRRDAEAAAPENPRLLWVVGPNLWYAPPKRGGGQDKAMEAYEKGLEAMRERKTNTSDLLEPSWGEPELLMSLAWSNLHRTTPNLNAAESYARRALAIVPHWHYVRDILLPQIRDAKTHSKLEVLKRLDRNHSLLSQATG